MNNGSATCGRPGCGLNSGSRRGARLEMAGGQAVPEREDAGRRQHVGRAGRDEVHHVGGQQVCQIRAIEHDARVRDRRAAGMRTAQAALRLRREVTTGVLDAMQHAHPLREQQRHREQEGLRGATAEGRG